MTNKQALKRAIDLISPYNPRADWDFDSNLCHLNTITKYIPKTAPVFDAGCGWGILALALKFLGYDMEAGDRFIFEGENSYSIGNLEAVKKIWHECGLNVRNIDIIKEDIGKKYGAVVSVATLEHQQNPRIFLGRLKEMTADGGYIYMATPNAVNLLNRVRVLFGRPAQGNLEEFFLGKNFVGHWREYTLKELKKMFEWAGLKIIMAKNRQETKPRLILRNFRDIYVNFMRLMACLIPGTGDANVILGKK